MQTSAITFARSAALAAALLVVVTAARPVLAQHGDAADHPAADAAGNHAAEAGSPDPLAIDIDLAIWTGVVFLLLFLVLRKFAWPQIVQALEEREKRIADHIAAAEAMQAQARQLLAEHEAKLAAAAGEVRELMDEARRDAEHTRKSIADRGHQDAQDEVARALREINRAKDAAVQELAVASANVAIDLARKVVREQLTPDQQNQIVREALGKFSAASPSKN